jgi:two-component system, response regulator
METIVDIVIVEDNANDSELIIRTLKKNNLANHLIVLEDGEQALDYLLCRGKYLNKKINNIPKVIFLDLKLPKVDGLDLLKEIKSNAHTKNIPVIIVTSSNQDPDIKTAYDLGANSYVVKPVVYTDFVKKINALGLYWLVVNEPPKQGI